MKYSLGRFVYGLAVIACGICALVWRRFDALAGVPRQIEAPRHRRLNDRNVM
jgi:hypothetical protein